MKENISRKVFSIYHSIPLPKHLDEQIQYSSFILSEPGKKQEEYAIVRSIDLITTWKALVTYYEINWILVGTSQLPLLIVKSTGCTLVDDFKVSLEKCDLATGCSMRTICYSCMLK